ncbi:hypothetical protein CYMTET_46088 [Cymbomonas tetramitiformis]|uniref:Phytanoyl-CoA dioxygenase family protein n=1 Tax=Cymbomonas tetramitiformis TaxID=36881 RepID=A0AAE0BY19_9CHLO|nr:hypothetical protein CYMTET_46088 [Cymbomonas tetramitiformis]
MSTPRLSTRTLTQDEILEFYRKGALTVRGLFNEEEVGLLQKAAKGDTTIASKIYGKEDASGGVAKLCLWNDLGDDFFSMFGRVARMVEAAETLLGGEEVYHYHSKLSIKEPYVGGAWEWHQDYGYWYNNGCLYPRMISCVIAIDRHTKENGCLQVVEGSHHLGRINHGITGQQAGADMERVQQVLKTSPPVHCELAPGDVLFTHCNTLHTSAPNPSPHPRWALIVCYNAKSNDPYKKHHHPQYTPLHKVTDNVLAEVGRESMVKLDDGSFLLPKTDHSHTGDT